MTSDQPAPLPSGTFQARDAATQAALPGSFRIAGGDAVAAAASAAAAAAAGLAGMGAARADLLEAIAREIEALGAGLIARAMAETALAETRLVGERGRTVQQLRAFAALLRGGEWQAARIEHGDPRRSPLPRPDLRRMLVPLGPVAVFAASNFPLAFSVAGGDSAAALAAGCPVVVKAHPAHPGTSLLVAEAVGRAIAASGAPTGSLTLLQGFAETGLRLVAEPPIRAVAFTGSHAGGRALMAAAAARPEPIPVFAEMGSINPVFVLAHALAGRGAAIAQAYARSVLLGCGQFCTNPGLLAVGEGAGWEPFRATLAAEIAAAAPAHLLSPAIRSGFADGLARQRALPGVELLAGSGAAGDGGAVGGSVLTVSCADFLAQPALADEVFGPSSLVVRCRSSAEMLALARALPGQLTASIHADAGDHPAAEPLVAAVLERAGRLVANGFPTGVEVSPAMQHGGPWPAASDARSTSVGLAAIERFLRPVCFQDFPEALLPAALREGNPLGLHRRVDGAPGRS